MTSSAPVTAAATAANAADNAQQNSFNPSWMRSAFNGAGGGAPVRSPKADYPLAAPVFVKNRYGREDMLALMGDTAGHPAPEGLQNCPFYVEEALPPIVCYPLSDLEQRLQHNINSSKAMSSLSHAERASVATGAAYGSGYADGSAGSHKTNSGAWTPVKPWSRNHPGGGTSAKGNTAPRPHVPPGRSGPRGDGTATNQDQPQVTPFGQRFANRGRGAPASARGGGVAGTAFNSRAQGLYDPRDPKDRPRNRMRSTSDEGDVSSVGEGGWTTAGGGKHAWGGHNKDAGQHNVWNGGEGGNGNVTEECSRKSESGPMPEWMDDGEDQEKTESSDDTTSATGSFDEHGRFRKKHYTSVDSKSSKKNSDTTQEQPRKISGTSAVSTSAPRVEKNVAPVQAASEANSSTAQTDTLRSDQEASRNFPNIRQQSDSVGYIKSAAAPQMLSTATPVVSSVPTSVPHQTPPQFYYLDPTKQERGPFEKIQMDSWYKRGYFTEGLEVRRHTDTKYRTLGELMQLNGRMTPFDYKDDVVPSPPVTAVFSNPTQPFAALFASGGMWGELGAPAANMMYGQPGYDPIAAERKRIEEEQRRILEEQVKMREYQERLMREMQKQREEHEKQLMEQKLALMKHQEEIERRERELKESAEETKARLEMERLALAEKARQIEEERAAKIKQELENARKAEEKRIEEEKRRRREEELERQRREEEEELKRQEEAERERRAQEAAEEEARRLRAAAEAAAEKLRLQQAEQQRKQRAAEEQRKKAAAASQQEKEKRQDNSKAFEIEETWQAAPKPTQTQAASDGVAATKKSPSTKAAPWVAAAVVPPKEKSLKEIQEEEERQLRAEQAEQARLRKEQQEALNIQSSGTWSNASQRLQWSQPPQTTVAKAPAAKPAWGGAGVEPPKTQSSPYWDGPSLQAANKVQNTAPKKAPVEKTSNAKSNAKTGSSLLVSEKAAKRALGMAEDNSVFLEWVVNRLKQLNSTVEADVLAMFIEGVENPDEVEDYVVGYLGDSKTVKDFVREFLQKRSDFRNRKQHAVKDDLSSARGAPVSGNGSGGFSAVQGRKKKSKGARLVVDGSCLGFRATSDPNRVNQGEIETVALTPGQKR